MNSWRRLLCHPGPYDTQDEELLFFFSSLESGYLAVCFPDSSITTSGTPALLAKRTFFCEGNNHAHFYLYSHGNWCIVYIKLHIVVNETKNPREPVVYSYDALEASVLTDFFEFFLFRRRRASGEWRWRLWCYSQSSDAPTALSAVRSTYNSSLTIMFRKSSAEMQNGGHRVSKTANPESEVEISVTWNLYIVMRFERIRLVLNIHRIL